MSEGLDRAPLARLHDVLAAHVEQAEVQGLVWLVALRGQVHVGVVGTLAAEGEEPIRRDTIFRISSMTKPITAVAALMLIEECALRLDEPIDRLLPELADRRVIAGSSGSLDNTVPADRPITVRDLLTCRLGLGLDFTATRPNPC